MDVKTIINRYAEYYADKTAIVFNRRRYTFKEVNERSIRLANALLNLGIKHNDRIGTVMGNCPEYVESMFAKHKIGAVDVILSPRIGTADMEYQINNAEINTLIVANEFISKLPERSKIPCVGFFKPGDLEFFHRKGFNHPDSRKGLFKNRGYRRYAILGSGCATAQFFTDNTYYI